jgi:hypothetical protein
MTATVRHCHAMTCHTCRCTHQFEGLLLFVLFSSLIHSGVMWTNVFGLAFPVSCAYPKVKMLPGANVKSECVCQAALHRLSQ